MIQKAASKVDIKLFGGEFAQVSIFYNKPKLLEYFIEKGADLKNPPESITPVQSMPTGGDVSENELGKRYRKTPYIV